MPRHLAPLLSLTTLLLAAGTTLLHPTLAPRLLIAQAQTIEARQAEANRLLQQGFQQYQTSQYPAAIQSWQQALDLYRAINDRNGAARVLMNLGVAYGSLSKYPKAIAYYEQALPLFRAVQDRNGEANALGNLGNAYFSLSQYPKAITFYEQALPLFRAVQDRNGEANALNNLGETYRNLSQYPKAITYYEQALPLFHAVQDRNGEAKALMNLGSAYFSLSQYSKAIAFYEQALPLFRAVQDRNGEAGALNNLGEAYRNLSQYPKAIAFYEQALPLFRAVEDRNGEASALMNLGSAYLSLSQYPKAITFYEQALPLFRTVQDRNGEAKALNNLGVAYLSLSQYPKAITYYEQALPLFRAVQDRNGEAGALNNLGEAYRNLSQYPKAITFYEQALPIYRAVQDRNGEANALNNLGNAYLSLSQYPKAITSYEQALPLFRAVQDRNGEAKALNNLAIAYYSLSQYPKAITYYEQALPLLRAVQDRNGEADALNNLGYTRFAAGQLAQAEPLLRQSVQLRECLRVGLKDDQKVSIFESQSNTYRTLQQVLIAQNKPTEALEIAERGRTRAFVELLAQRLNPPSTASKTCTPVQPPTLVQIQQIAKQQNATLVEYSVIGNERLYIWVVQPTGEVTFKQVELKPILRTAALADLVKEVRYEDVGMRARGLGVVEKPNMAQNRELTQVASLKTLHQLLIAPIANQLPTDPNQRIIFIPHDALFLVPFAALQAQDGKYLIEQHTILTAPSIQVLELTRRQRVAGNQQKTGRALIVGNPVMPQVTLVAGEKPFQLSALPGAEKEAKALAQLFKTPALIGAQATEAVVKAQMPKASLIHLATHGLFNDQQGLGSSIALTATGKEDGLLTAAEILELKLQAELVVLSACDTGRGEITGDGVIGLSRSLISAGVPSVVVSLWSVPDAPTAALMVRFYQNLQQTPDKAQALRQAMLQIKSSYPKPRDWAAFTLIGEAN